MYPRWRYKQGEAKIIFNIEEELHLGGVWYDTPTELEKALAQPEIVKIPAIESSAEAPTQLKVVKKAGKK